MLKFFKMWFGMVKDQEELRSVESPKSKTLPPPIPKTKQDATTIKKGSVADRYQHAYKNNKFGPNYSYSNFRHMCAFMKAIESDVGNLKWDCITLGQYSFDLKRIYVYSSEYVNHLRFYTNSNNRHEQNTEVSMRKVRDESDEVKCGRLPYAGGQDMYKFMYDILTIGTIKLSNDKYVEYFKELSGNGWNTIYDGLYYYHKPQYGVEDSGKMMDFETWLPLSSELSNKLIMSVIDQHMSSVTTTSNYDYINCKDVLIKPCQNPKSEFWEHFLTIEMQHKAIKQKEIEDFVIETFECLLKYNKIASDSGVRETRNIETLQQFIDFCEVINRKINYSYVELDEAIVALAKGTIEDVTDKVAESLERLDDSDSENQVSVSQQNSDYVNVYVPTVTPKEAPNKSGEYHYEVEGWEAPKKARREKEIERSKPNNHRSRIS